MKSISVFLDFNTPLKISLSLTKLIIKVHLTTLCDPLCPYHRLSVNKKKPKNKILELLIYKFSNFIFYCNLEIL